MKATGRTTRLMGLENSSIPMVTFTKASGSIIRLREPAGTKENREVSMRGDGKRMSLKASASRSGETATPTKETFNED